MSSGTILVVYDEPSIRLLCRVNLELEGYCVLEAESLGDARRFLSEGAVDVALLDVHVGAENGLELADELRRDRPEVGVALLTGSFDVTPAARSRVDAVLPKPFSLDQLSATVGWLAMRERAPRLHSAE